MKGKTMSKQNYSDLENNVVQSLDPQFPHLKLTYTMWDKNNIDGGVFERFASLYGVNFKDMDKGDKQTLSAIFRFNGTDVPTKINFYRTKARGDKRFSIQSIKQKANVGDIIALTYEHDPKTNKNIIILNLTAQAEKREKING